MSLRVAIDARLEQGRAGGVQQALEALTAALAQAPDVVPVYVTWQGRDEWLRRHLDPDAEVYPIPRAHGALRSVARRALAHPVGARLLGSGLARRDRRAGPRPSTGVLEATGADVVHFPMQRAELVDRPFVYQPWDLQHRWFPEHFTPAERRRRDVEYRAYCAAASAVVVATSWVRDDLIDAYGIDAGKIAVIPPWAPASRSASWGDRASASATVGDHALYPAQAWPHKNHRRLVEAIALLRRDGIDVPLVCPGATNAAVHGLRRLTAELGVADLVTFPGYVDEPTLAELYATARCVVFPSRFEGWGLPVGEAMAAGVAVACSEGRHLDDVAAGAAVRFDPCSVESLADAVRTLWTDDRRRRQMVEAGHEAVQRLSWPVIGGALAAVYQRVAEQSPHRARPSTGTGTSTGTTR